METRKETAGFVRAFALNQFDKAHTLSDSTKTEAPEDNDDIGQHIQSAQRAYGPRRRFKRGDGAPKDETTRIKSTLLEYGILPIQTNVSANVQEENNASQDGDEIENESISVENRNNQVQLDEERLSASTVGSIVGLQAQEIVQAAERYSSLSTDAEVNY